MCNESQHFRINLSKVASYIYLNNYSYYLCTLLQFVLYVAMASVYPGKEDKKLMAHKDIELKCRCFTYVTNSQLNYFNAFSH